MKPNPGVDQENDDIGFRNGDLDLLVPLENGRFLAVVLDADSETVADELLQKATSNLP